MVAVAMPDRSNQKNQDAETLLNYKKLLDEGVITQAEFDKKKSDLLGWNK